MGESSVITGGWPVWDREAEISLVEMLRTGR